MSSESPASSDRCSQKHEPEQIEVVKSQDSMPAALAITRTIRSSSRLEATASAQEFTTTADAASVVPVDGKNIDADKTKRKGHSLLSSPVFQSPPANKNIISNNNSGVFDYLLGTTSDHTQDQSTGSGGYSTPSREQLRNTSEINSRRSPSFNPPASPFIEADEDNYTDFVLSDEEEGGLGGGLLGIDNGAVLPPDNSSALEREEMVCSDEEERPTQIPTIPCSKGVVDDAGGDENNNEDVDEGGYADDESEGVNEKRKGFLRHASLAASVAAALFRTPSSGGSRNQVAETSRVGEEEQITSLMVEDKPWRVRRNSIRRQHRRRDSSENAARTPGRNTITVTTTTATNSPTEGQQQSHQSPFPLPGLRYIRARSNDPKERTQGEGLATPSGKNEPTAITFDGNNNMSPEDALPVEANETAGVEDYSSDESSFGEEMSIESSSNFDEDEETGWEKPVDWSSMPSLPEHFYAAGVSPYGSSSSGGGFLDAVMIDQSLTEVEGNRFVWEHGVLLQAVLQLLAERDQVGIEGSLDSDDNIYKKGPLKKLTSLYKGAGAVAGAVVSRRKRPVASAKSKWKIKYVELRRGNLCYYEDSGHSSTQGRKTVHLRQADTTVELVEGNSSNNTNASAPRGFVFKLNVKGSPTLFWMASSEEERQAWIRVIRAAMIGDETSSRRILDLAPFQEAIDAYKALRERLQETDTQEDYIGAIHLVMEDVEGMQVPVQWVQDQLEKLTNVSSRNSTPLLKDRPKTSASSASPHKRLKTSIAAFWRSLGQTTMSLNGITVPRGSPSASTRIVGSLTRCILEHDKAFWCATVDDEDDFGPPMPSDSNSNGSIFVSELQAVSYARNILLAVLRNKEQQVASCAVNYLFQNPDLVVIASSPPTGSLLTQSYSSAVDDAPLIQLEVSFAGEDLGTVPDYDSQAALADDNEMLGWVWMRRKHYAMSKWRKRYVVLSGAVINYYEAATPRPHGLQGQLVLSGATVRQEESNAETNGIGPGGVDNNRLILCVTTQDQERLLSFESESDFSEWKVAIQGAIDSCAMATPAKSIETPIASPSHMVATSGVSCVTPAQQTEESLSNTENNKKSVKSSLMKGIRGTIPVKGIKVIKSAKDGGIKLIKISKDGGNKVIRGAVGMLRQRNSSDYSDDQHDQRRRPSLQMLMNSTSVLQGKRGPTVQCVVQATETFWIKARNDEDGPEETWMSVKAKVFQAFLMSGGPSGRMAQGDALVELEFI